MRCTLTKEEIKETVNLLLNKYNLSTRFLNKLYGRKLRAGSESILNELKYLEHDKNNLCRLIVIKEGVNLFSGSSEIKKELRRKIISKMSDGTIIELFNNFAKDNNNKITSVHAILF